MTRSTVEIYQHHMDALMNGDFSALIADYADDAVLMTMEGTHVGKGAIQTYFVNALSAMPNTKLSPGAHVVHGDYVLLNWTGTSDIATVPHGVDTFVIRDDKIRLQTVCFMVIPK